MDGPTNPAPEACWDTLLALVPEARSLALEQRKLFSGLVRQVLAGELQEEREAVNIFRMENVPALAQLIASLPLHSREEKLLAVDELQLSPEAAQMELANWAFRHQSVRGELLVRELLVPFRLIRLQPVNYLLLAREAWPEIPANFTQAFSRPPDVHTARALRVSGRAWAAWAWFLDPDRAAAERAAAELRHLWQGQAR